jgi:hypothetical protein
VTPLGWLAAIVLFVPLPIPLFWFVVHPQINYWRNHRSAGYASALLAAWVPVTFFLILSRRELFLHAWPAAGKSCAKASMRGFVIRARSGLFSQLLAHGRA